MRKKHTIQGYLTRRRNGLYLLTYHPPIIEKVGNLDEYDAYIAPGDPLGVNNLCEWTAKEIWGIENLEPCKSVKIWLCGGNFVDDEQKS